MIKIKFSLFLIILILLNSCVIKNNFEHKKGLFCSYTSSIEDNNSKYIIKFDSNNIEIEEMTFHVGVGRFYGKGKWSYISNNKIIFECDSDKKYYYYSSIAWDSYPFKGYIKKISDKKIIFYEKYEGRYIKIILQSDWCDCIPDGEKSIIIKDSDSVSNGSVSN
jgi:hypothetical protein